MFTRREILKAFLGVGLAASACKRQNRVDEIDGKIIGAADNVGHILRDRRNFEVAEENWRKIDTVIVGGGIAGLSAAWNLKREGYENFELLELESRYGGTSTSDRGTPTAYPWGAHYLPVPFKENEKLIELLGEMSLIELIDSDGEPQIKEQFLVRDPEERIFFEGRWYGGLYPSAGASEMDLRELAVFEKEISKWVDWRDSNGKRAFVVPVENCSVDAEVVALDQISFADWLDSKGLNSPRLRWYCDYACRDDYGLRTEQTSAWAGLFYFCSRVRKGGEESQPFVTFPEGNGRYVNHFVSKVSQHLRDSALVVEIIPNDEAIDVVYYNTKTKSANGVRAQNVVFAAPLFTAPFMIRDFAQSPPFDALRFQHNSWFVANLFLEDRPNNNFVRDFPLAWDNVLYHSRSLGYVTATHQPGLDYGKTILTYFYAMAAEDNTAGRQKLFALDWREMADVILADLGTAHRNLNEVTKRIDIMRWGHAMISPEVGFIHSGEREKAAKPFRNIHFAHADLGGVALFEESFHHGLRASNAIIGAN